MFEFLVQSYEPLSMHRNICCFIVFLICVKICYHPLSNIINHLYICDLSGILKR